MKRKREKPLFKRRTSAAFEIVASLKSLPEIRRAILAQAKSLGIDGRRIYRVILAVEEACSNVIRHAYDRRTTNPLNVMIETTSNRVHVLIRDVGRPFDFNEYPSRDMVQRSLRARARGGYGIHLIKSLMDRCEYVRSDTGENNLSLVKYFGKPVKAAQGRRDRA